MIAVRLLLIVGLSLLMSAAGAADLGGVWQIRGKATLFPEGAGLPPLTPQGMAAFEKNRAGIAAGDRTVDLTLRCSSPGAPRVMLLPYPFEILQEPDHILFLFQWNHLFRQIVMDGRRDPYVLPSAMGFSAGRWDGDTLVLTTTDFNAKTFLDSTGLPHSDQLKLTERLRLRHRGKILEWRITIDDPSFYSRPWDSVGYFDRLTNTSLSEDVCVDRVAAELEQRNEHSFALMPGNRGGQDLYGPYEVVRNWPQDISTLPGNSAWTYGAAQGVFAESPDRILMLYRGELPNIKRPARALLPSAGPSVQFPVGRLPWRDATLASLPGHNATGEEPGAPTDGWLGVVGVDAKWENCIVVVDGQGKIVERWTQWDKILQRPHFVAINPYDPEKHVWIVDDHMQAIYKFTHDGSKLVQVLGTPRVKGADATHFNRPTFLAWLPDSTLFVADGYNGTRIAKFDREGHFLMQWGKQGIAPNEKRPGYMNNVHGLAIDPQTRHVFVNDRANHRIQVFDEQGRYLYEWSAGPDPSDIHVMSIGADRTLWAFDRGTSRMLKYDLDGRLLYEWGVWGDFPGALWGVHGFSVDQDGNLYVAEVDNGRVQKFQPRAGVDPWFLVSKPVYAAWK